MIAITGFKEIKNLIHVCKSLIPCYKSPFHTNDQCHHSKTCSAAGNHVTGGIAFPCHTARRMGKIVEISESLMLHKLEKFNVRNQWELRRRIKVCYKGVGEPVKGEAIQSPE